MKHIQDFFHPLQDLHLHQEEKMQIRQQILAKRQRTIFLRKFRYYTKVTTFMGISAFGLALFLSAFQPQESERNIASLTDAFITLTRNEQPQIAQAETIGRLLEIYGVAHVLDKDGNIVSKTDLFAGEMVILQPGAKVVVQIRENTFAQIIGPAKFTLEAVPNGAMTYILNILEGTYVEVATQQPKLVSSSDSQEIDKDDNQTSVKRPEHIVIKTKQVEVVSDEAKDSHFAITQSDKTAEVVTSEGKVIVKNISQDKGKEISLVAGETAMVDTEGVAIHLPASHEEVKQLVKTSEALLIRYERSTQDSTSLPMDNTVIAEESSDSGAKNESEFIGLFDNDQRAISTPPLDSGSVNQIQQQLGANHQRIISNDDLTALEQALNPDITQYNIDQMLLRKAKGNTNSFVIAYGNLLDQLNGSYKIIGQPQPSITPGLDSLEAGIVVANKLTSLLETTYSVPPSLKSDIAFIIDGIIQVQTLPIGAYPEVKDIATLKALLLDQAAQTPPENDNQ